MTLFLVLLVSDAFDKTVEPFLEALGFLSEASVENVEPELELPIDPSSMSWSSSVMIHDT